MKRLLLFTLLCASHNTFCLKQEDAQSNKKSDEKVGALLTDMIRAKSRKECKEIGMAYYDLHRACEDNECKVTDETSKDILQKYNLVDSEGALEDETCNSLE